MPVVSADLFPAERASLNFAPVHQAIDLTSDRRKQGNLAPIFRRWNCRRPWYPAAIY
jgi:hypothetical protein